MDLFYRILRPLLCPTGVLLCCGSASKMGFSTTMAAVCPTRPVIVGIPKGRSGTITGTVSPGAVVYAEDIQGHIVKSTVADSNGTFTLSPLPATASGSSGYTVVVASPQPVTGATLPAPDMAPDIVLAVPVTAGQGTILSASALPADSSADVTYSGNITLATPDSDVLVVAQEPVTNPSDSTTSTVMIAESLAIPATASGNTVSTYSLTFANINPEIAVYNSSGLTFAPSPSLPTIRVLGFGSDGSTGTAPATPPYDFIMSGTGDTTFSLDN